jgi:putative hydrolase of HD superfamily
MPAPPDRLAAILDFLMLIDRFKGIERGGYLADGSRRETDSDHAWHLALYAILLHGEIGFDTDLGRVLCLVAVHDLVEIYAGDTYAYDDAALADQAAREEAAAERLFGMLPEDLRGRVDGLWREFEAGATPEARFARALDRLQAFAQSVLAGGRAWREHGVSRARTRERMAEALRADPAIARMVEALYDRADAGGFWPDGD